MAALAALEVGVVAVAAGVEEAEVGAGGIRDLTTTAAGIQFP